MNYKLVIDSDSLLYVAGYRHIESLNAEHMYADFLKEVGKIETALWARTGYCKGDTLSTELILTVGSNFRYTIFPQYKSNRKEKTELDKTVSKLRKLALERLDYCYYHENAEADDVIISMVNTHTDSTTKLFISCIDKDVTNASLVPSWNYKKNVWDEASIAEQVEKWYLTQAIMGDSSDAIPGIKGTGKVGAAKIMSAQYLTAEQYAAHFESREHCELMNQLVRMDQYNIHTKELKLWTLADFIEPVEPEEDIW